jgi:hypothetical protein
LKVALEKWHLATGHLYRKRMPPLLFHFHLPSQFIPGSSSPFIFVFFVAEILLVRPLTFCPFVPSSKDGKKVDGMEGEGKRCKYPLK